MFSGCARKQRPCPSWRTCPSWRPCPPWRWRWLPAARSPVSLFEYFSFLLFFFRRGLIWDALETWARPSQDTVIRNMQWDEQKNYSDQWTRSIRPPQAKSVWCSEALWQVYKIYKLCCHGPGIKSVVTNRLLIATVAHNIFWIDMQNISFGLKCRITRRATCPHLFLALKYNWVFNIFCVLNIFDVALFVFTLAVGTCEEMVNTWLWQSSFSSGWKGELDHNDPWIKGMLVILVLITLNMFTP